MSSYESEFRSFSTSSTTPLNTPISTRLLSRCTLPKVQNPAYQLRRQVVLFLYTATSRIMIIVMISHPLALSIRTMAPIAATPRLYPHHCIWTHLALLIGSAAKILGLVIGTAPIMDSLSASVSPSHHNLPGVYTMDTPLSWT